MSFLFRRLSYYLQNHPLATNITLSTIIGFFGDVVCQCIYEPWARTRPPLTYSFLPPESSCSVFLIEIPYAPTYLRSSPSTHDDEPEFQHGTPQTLSCVLLDLRRSIIFSSFTFFFGVRYFMMIYRILDHFIPPKTITKKAALGKGFLTWIFSQFLNPVFLIYFSALNHFFIYRDGRDGRHRLSDMTTAGLAQTQQGISPQGTLVYQAGYWYVLTENKFFDVKEYVQCVILDVKRRIAKDFIDIIRYGFVFWGLNWLPIFYYIPSHFRIAYGSCIQLVWSGIMSFILNRANETKYPGKA